jgi:hypothetical protein
MPEIRSEAILSNPSLRAGVDALERLHGRHLADMSPAEQADARVHWQDQVEQILGAVHQELSAGPEEGRGSAVISFQDGDGDAVEVSAHFEPELRDLGDEQVEGTPAQILALTALDAVQAEAEEEGPA